MSETFGRVEQAWVLRRDGHEDHARAVESGRLILEPDLVQTIRTRWLCLQMADALQELSRGLDEARVQCTCGSDRFYLVSNSRTGEQTLQCTACKSRRPTEGKDGRP